MRSCLHLYPRSGWAYKRDEGGKVGRLSGAYRAARNACGKESLGPPDEMLEVTLAALCARGQTAHPDLAIEDCDLVGHLARCDAPVAGSVEDALAHAGDLYLAFACVRGNDLAASRIVVAHADMMARVLRKIDSDPTFIDDVVQRFWDAALVGTISAPPRLATYSGLGPLAGWIGVGTQRIALMMQRHDQAEGRARRSAIVDADVLLHDAELAFIKERYRGEFELATRKALQALDDRERMILRLHLVDGITIERIGKAYGVSHSTVSRWFAAARDKVIAETQRVLNDELRLSPGEFESLKRLVLSQLDLSMSMLPVPPA